MFSPNGSGEAEMYLIQAALLTEDGRAAGSTSDVWVESCCRELADKVDVPRPRVEWRCGRELNGALSPVCHSAVNRWAQIDRRGNSIRFSWRAASELGRDGLRLITAHLFSHLKANEPEWLHDLRALDLVDRLHVPVVPETAVAIATTPRYRMEALEFRSGAHVIEIGDRLASGDWGAWSPCHCVFQAPSTREHSRRDLSVGSEVEKWIVRTIRK